MPTAHANGIDIYYETHGEGPPLLLIGGLSTDITDLRRMISRLPPRHRVIAFDNRGAGRTDKPDVPYSIPMMADDAAGLLDVIGVKHTDVLGISMGVRIAVDLTLGHPS
ncbi:MAG TPA: alpha/beta hydrolase, partial [Actinomycetota bacterium]|nr:alpha/beta hydrolase [Actinomycetota bacterium]